MVRSYLIENRICYKSDGGSSAADDARESATPAQTDARGRPLVRGTTNLIDTSRQILPPEDNEPNIPPPTQVEFGRGRADLSPPTPASTAVAGQNQRPSGTLRMLNAGGQDLFDISQVPPAPPATVSAAPPPVNDSAEMARQLIENAANESIASGIDREILDSVPGAAGRNDPASGFFADTYDALYGTPDPTDPPLLAPGTGIGTLLGSGPLAALTNQPDPADAAAFNVGQLEALGGVRDPQTGAITGARAGPGTLNMNRFGMVTYSGLPDPNYTGAFQNLVRGNTGTMSSEDTDDSPMPTQAPAPVDPGTTTPEQIDDLAINYLRNPYYLYGGAGNLFQPYGYAPGTLVDLLQTRNMTMPDQAAPNLNLFGNPRDFT
ncbi:MAG: hypothetical protein L7S70_07200 [Pseudomonadales bacterium]|nr:hypothetical protein [Pseudomonadales bacterium]